MELIFCKQAERSKREWSRKPETVAYNGWHSWYPHAENWATMFQKIAVCIKSFLGKPRAPSNMYMFELMVDYLISYVTTSRFPSCNGMQAGNVQMHSLRFYMRTITNDSSIVELCLINQISRGIKWGGHHLLKHAWIHLTMYANWKIATYFRTQLNVVNDLFTSSDLKDFVHGRWKKQPQLKQTFVEYNLELQNFMNSFINVI